MISGLLVFMSPLFLIGASLVAFTEYGFSLEAIKMLGIFFIFFSFSMNILSMIILLWMFHSGKKFEKIMLALGFSNITEVDLSDAAIDGGKETLFLYRKAIEKDPFPVEKETAVNKRKIQIFDRSVL